MQNKVRGPSPQTSPFMMPPGAPRMSGPGQHSVRSFTPVVLPESQLFESTPSFSNTLIDNKPKVRGPPAPKVGRSPVPRPAAPPNIEQSAPAKSEAPGGVQENY